MTKFAVFLRGINVGGNRKIPMSDLRRLLVGKTSDPNVRTYIASGNAIFAAGGRAEDWITPIAEAISAEFGFDVSLVILDEGEMRATLQDCPFPRDAGKQVHAFLCSETPQLDAEGVAAQKSAREEVAVVGRVVWLHAPDGIGRSKLAAAMEKLIGVPTTARNLNTITKMVEMLDT